MGTEQQFCLRWNNHQSTLVAVFDTLLESGTLVDCTLAAEGQYLKAHKVVLSACSPYFELLLSQHYEKHPIVILKDVKFQELKAMMDYMYRGEVNISQDQLGALLKAAESLQIKGLSDSGGGGNERDSGDKRHERRKEVPPPPPPRSPPILPHSSGLTIEHRRPVQQSVPPPIVDLPEDSPPPPSLPRVSGSREGSVSPVPRKRKKHRRRSSGGDEAAPMLSMTESHETSSSCELPNQSQASAPSIPATITPVVPTPVINKPAIEPAVALGPEEQTESEMMTRSLPSTQVNVSSPQTMPHEPDPVQKVEPPSELLEPKAEYLDEVNEDSVEDLTLDDDMDEMDQARPGPSHGGEGSSSQGAGFAPWHVAADRSTDEVFMAAQEAVGAHRDSQVDWRETADLGIIVQDVRSMADMEEKKKIRRRKKSGFRGKKDMNLSCTHCGKRYLKKLCLQKHMTSECGKKQKLQCTYCLFRCYLKRNLSAHVLSVHSKCKKENTGSFVCSMCGRDYYSKSSLRSHEKYICGKEPVFKCDHCSFRAKLKGNLKVHMRIMHSQ